MSDVLDINDSVDLDVEDEGDRKFSLQPNQTLNTQPHFFCRKRPTTKRQSRQTKRARFRSRRIKRTRKNPRLRNHRIGRPRR